jgi:hypothetical protein
MSAQPDLLPASPADSRGCPVCGMTIGFCFSPDHGAAPVAVGLAVCGGCGDILMIRSTGAELASLNDLLAISPMASARLDFLQGWVRYARPGAALLAVVLRFPLVLGKHFRIVIGQMAEGEAAPVKRFRAWQF